MNKRRINELKGTLLKLRAIFGEGAESDWICAHVWNLYKEKFGDFDFDL